MAAVLGFGYHIALNRMGKDDSFDVLPWLQRRGCQMRGSQKGFWTALRVATIPLTAVAWILWPDVGNVG